MSNEEEALVPTVGTSQLAKWFICALSGLLFLGGFPAIPDAVAHAKLIGSRPKAFEVLATPPAHVELWFNERLEDEFNAIEVTDATGRRVERGMPHVNSQNRTKLLVPLEHLAPGSYVIHWKILSLDGHSARGRLLFTVK